MLNAAIRNIVIPGALGLLLCTASAASPELPPLPVGMLAPDFTVTAWNGGKVHLSDYRGKIVVLDFWATWCGPCNQAMPDLQDVYDQYKSDVVVLAVCVWDTPDDANTWIPSHNYTLNFALDTSNGKRSPTTDLYQVHAIPTTYVIDQTGHIAAGHVVMEEDELIAAIKPLATPKPLSTFATAMADGEMGIGGVVTSVGPNSLTLSSIDVVLPGGKNVAFDTPRAKTIALTDSTTIINGHSGKSQQTIAVNTYINIIGADQGSGKKLIAHRIQAY